MLAFHNPQRQSDVCSVQLSDRPLKSRFCSTQTSEVMREGAAWSRSHLSVKRHSTLATGAGDVTMPAAGAQAI